MPLVRPELSFLEKTLTIHRYYYPFISNTVKIRKLFNLSYSVSRCIRLIEITKTSERIPDRLWVWPHKHFVNPTRGPAVLYFETNSKEQILS